MTGKESAQSPPPRRKETSQKGRGDHLLHFLRRHLPNRGRQGILEAGPGREAILSVFRNVPLRDCRADGGGPPFSEHRDKRKTENLINMDLATKSRRPSKGISPDVADWMGGPQDL